MGRFQENLMKLEHLKKLRTASSHCTCQTHESTRTAFSGLLNTLLWICVLAEAGVLCSAVASAGMQPRLPLGGYVAEVLS